MSFITNKMANSCKEIDCIAVTPERKYYNIGKTFVKRSLRPREWQVSQFSGTIHVPRQGKERLLNEAAAMRFVKEHTRVPIPVLHCAFTDDDAVYLVMESVAGVSMADLTEDEKHVVKQELAEHLDSLHSLRSSTLGGISGLMIPPYRVVSKTFRDDWDLRPSETEEYVFCHNDLSQQNVIVDPKSLKINAIIDWEYSGFFPKQFEFPFFERLGPSVAMDGEEDDSKELLALLMSQQVFVFLRHESSSLTNRKTSEPLDTNVGLLKRSRPRHNDSLGNIVTFCPTARTFLVPVQQMELDRPVFDVHSSRLLNKRQR